jgi:hypothetical protein
LNGELFITGMLIMHHEVVSLLKLQVSDAYDPDWYQELEIEIESHGIAIRPVGYGDCSSPNGQGSPVFIEFRNGVPTLVVWDDINREGPSHIISLGNAAEPNRREQ